MKEIFLMLLAFMLGSLYTVYHFEETKHFWGNVDNAIHQKAPSEKSN